jgi:DNA repair protein RecN (Recombination protein N)
MILKQISGVGSALDRVSCGFETMAEHASAARHASESLSKVDSQFDVLCGRVSALDLEIQDILSDVRMHLSDIEMLDASSLEEVESRLDVIFRYKSKYHVQSLSDLMKLSDRLELELKSLDSHGERLLQLQSALADSGVTLKSFAMELSEVRKKAATALSKKIEKEMESLHFEVCNFEIRIDSDYTSYGPNGCDQIQFYVSMNAGSAPKLLSDVASGGELSRIMLAIRSVFSDRFLNRTAVFDEIDAGVGGLTAVKIGEKLHALSQKAQIFCVTHLAQIAKFADHHVTVSKSTSKGKTVTTTHVLSSHERGAELKRMVGGEDVASLIRS